MLQKIFIKNWQDTDRPEVRRAYANTAGAYGIITNGLLGVSKLIVGILSRSVSIMADAVNNISDMATSILTIAGFRLASKKPNRKHPYGYARYEYVTGFVIGIFMLVMGIIFAKEAIGKIIEPVGLEISASTYIVLILALLVKLSQMGVYNSFSKAIDSGSLKASATDTRNDIISSLAIIVSMVIMGIFKINIDGYLALAVSVFVIISSLQTCSEELQPIIGIVPTEQQIKEITDKLSAYPVVHGIHDLVLHNYGVGNDFITAHIEFDSKMDVLEAHEAMDKIENDFRVERGQLLTIHMDPVVIGDPKQDELHAKVVSCLRELNPDLMIHDFRMVPGQKNTNLIFDCVVGQECPLDTGSIREYLSSRFNCGTDPMHYSFVIEVDRPYA